VKALPPALRSVSPAELAERLAAERRGTPFVLYLDGDRRQRIVELGDAALSIGRAAESDIPLDWDDEVSRAHAVLERVGSSWTVVDDGISRNGTYVNGERVHGRRRLEYGDAILVGETLLVFVGVEKTARTTATTRRGAPPALSPAQQRVLDALCAPALDSALAAPPSNHEIAAQLFLSVETVKSHLHALYELFDVADVPAGRKRGELVKRAFERGVVSAGARPSRREGGTPRPAR
jgi:pSer/pThr/pTyr-binding forkhead associated (FHA) protein